MKLTQILKESKKTLFSIEILPPLKGKSIQSIYDGIDPLMEFKPAFVDVTYHREELIYKKRADGLIEEIPTELPFFSVILRYVIPRPPLPLVANSAYSILFP